MKNIGLAIVVLLFINLLANESFGQKKFPKEVLLPELWEKVEIAAPEECAGTPPQCALKMLRDAGIDAGSAPATTVYRLGERDGRNLTVVFVTQKIEEDDSLAGVRYRLVLSLGDVEDRTFKLETLGRQYKCMRGRRGWGRALCS